MLLEYSLRHKKLVVVAAPPAFICTFTENPLLNFYCVKSGLEIKFQICNLLRPSSSSSTAGVRESSSSTACFRRAGCTPSSWTPASSRTPSSRTRTISRRLFHRGCARARRHSTGRVDLAAGRPASRALSYGGGAPVFVLVRLRSSIAVRLRSSVWALPRGRARGLAARPEEAALGRRHRPG